MGVQNLYFGFFIFFLKLTELCRFVTRGKPSTTQRLSEALSESPVDYKTPLTGRYIVLLTVGDMYATDNLPNTPFVAA